MASGSGLYRSGSDSMLSPVGFGEGRRWLGVGEGADPQLALPLRGVVIGRELYQKLPDVDRCTITSIALMQASEVE